MQACRLPADHVSLLPTLALKIRALSGGPRLNAMQAARDLQDVVIPHLLAKIKRRGSDDLESDSQVEADGPCRLLPGLQPDGVGAAAASFFQRARHERGTDAAALCDAVHVKADDLDGALGDDAGRRVWAVAHERIADRRAIGVLRHQHHYIVGRNGFAHHLGRKSSSQVGTELGLGMGGAVRLGEEARAEYADRRGIVGGAAPNSERDRGSRRHQRDSAIARINCPSSAPISQITTPPREWSRTYFILARTASGSS